MAKSLDRKSAFGLSGDQIGRLLSIGSDDGGQGTLHDNGYAEKTDSLIEQVHGSETSEMPLQIQGYEIREKVAEAGQGQVWRAVQLSTGREVAIKVPNLASVTSERPRLRFEREIELVARLKHPNIARIYESGIDRGQHYYVMDFINGFRLDEYVRKNNLAQEQILELMRSICNAVQHAHQMGVIHRDLKPSNVIVTNEGHPYVVDFGLAKELLEDGQGPLVSMDGEAIGTPAYMSPEQAQGQTGSIDTRTDVYSLGVILFGLLTGELPHDLSGSRQQVLRRIAEGEFRQPRCVCPSIDRDLELLLLKALDHDPDRRYTSANDLAVDIDNFLTGRALVAGPPRVSYRVKKFIRRHRALASSVIVATIVISVCLIAGIAMYARAEIQAQRSQAVRSLLNSMLSALSPYRSQGGEVTPLSVLDRLATALEGKFPDAPLIEASFRRQLGGIYAQNDNQEEAVLHLKRALDIQREHLGDNHRDTVKSKHELGVAYWNQGRVNEAEPLMSESVRQIAQQYGPDHASTLHAKIMLANIYSYMGERSKALRINQDVLECAGNDHKEATLAMGNIGISYSDIGDYETAEKWLGKAVETASRILGKDHGWSVELTGALGAVYLRLGKCPEAEATLKDAYDRARLVFGNSEVTHNALSDLIRVYVAWGHLEKAAGLSEELRASQIRQLATQSKGALEADESTIPNGSTHYDGRSKTYTLRGSGVFFWDVFDEFHFAYKTLKGNGTIQARIDNIPRTTRLASAGIMMRNGLEPTSKRALVVISQGGIVEFQHRMRERGPVYSRCICVRDMALPYWIRLNRQGNNFTAYHSQDGLDWHEIPDDDPNQPISVELTMSETTHIGLAVTSADTVRTAEARFSHVGTTGNVSPTGPFTESRNISLLTATEAASGSTQGTTVTPSSPH